MRAINWKPERVVDVCHTIAIARSTRPATGSSNLYQLAHAQASLNQRANAAFADIHANGMDLARGWCLYRAQFEGNAEQCSYMFAGSCFLWLNLRVISCCMHLKVSRSQGMPRDSRWRVQPIRDAYVNHRLGSILHGRYFY